VGHRFPQLDFLWHIFSGAIASTISEFEKKLITKFLQKKNKMTYDLGTIAQNWGEMTENMYKIHNSDPLPEFTEEIVNEQNNQGKTLLMYLIQMCPHDNHWQIVEKILATPGFNPNLVDYNGQTAVMLYLRHRIIEHRVFQTVAEYRLKQLLVPSYDFTIYDNNSQCVSQFEKEIWVGIPTCVLKDTLSSS
jgi:hypothetical protein